MSRNALFRFLDWNSEVYFTLIPSLLPHMVLQESISLMIVDRSFYNRVSLLNSARVYCVPAFQKDGLGQDQGRWVFASFCKPDFLQICLTAELRLVSRGASSGLEIWNQLTLPRKSSKQPRINADWTLDKINLTFSLLEQPWTWQVTMTMHLEFQSPILKTTTPWLW